MDRVIFLLEKKHKKVSTMESCTGGAIANAITNIKGASGVFEFGAVTYSNEYKIKMGVDSKIIKEYSVYSMETAHEMSRAITEFTNSDYGIGITGKINTPDPNNPTGGDHTIFLGIYDKNTGTYHDKIIKAIQDNRSNNKEFILEQVIKILVELLEQSF